MAKQIRVIAISAIICGKTTTMLCPKGRGFLKRAERSSSMGPIRIRERLVFLMGSIIVAVAFE